MRKLEFALLSLLFIFTGNCPLAQAPKAQAPKYPPLSEYIMPRDAEIALAKSAAPANIGNRATIKVLTTSGFQVVHEGDNGFVCMVMCGWSAPTYTPAPFRDLVYDTKALAPICFNPAAARIVMPYYELRTKLGLQGKTPHPHMMIFAPYYENSMLGGHEFGSPFPLLSDDAGTPVAVVLIPVDDKLAIKAGAK
jgi:hypothetical protein